jgi:hypothetical protein
MQFLRKRISSPFHIDRNDPSLVIYLPLWYGSPDMTGSTIFSQDLNRHSCTVTGATWGVTGRTMDGDDYISIPANAAFAPTTPTIMGWVKQNDVDAIGAGCLLSNETPVLSLKELTPNTMGWGLRLRIGAATKTSNLYTATLGVWYHFAGTYDKSNIRFYVNGTQLAPVAQVGDIDADVSNTLEIGRIFGSQYSKATFGEVYYYPNRVLSPGEIAQNFQKTKWKYQ